jgi:hypothetical protein
MSAPSITSDSAASAYESITAELAALRERELLPVNVDVSRAASRALRAAPRIHQLIPEMERQLPELPFDRVRKLETYALAAWYAHASAWSVRTLSPTRELVARAKPLRHKLLRAAECFGTAGFVNEEEVAHIRRGQGRRDMAKDMVALAKILRDGWHRFGDNALVTREEVEKAGDLGHELMQAIGHGEYAARMKRSAMADQCARAFTLLWRAYDTARRAVIFLRWDHGDAQQIAPSLFIDAGSRRKRTKRAAGVAASPESSGADSARSPADPADRSSAESEPLADRAER